MMIEGIKKGNTVEILKNTAKELKTKHSGSKEDIIEAMFNKQDIDLENLLNKLVNDRAVQYIREQLGNDESTKEMIVKQSITEIFAKTGEKLSIRDILAQFTNEELKNMCKILECNVSGNKTKKIENILVNDEKKVMDAVIKEYPGKVNKLKEKFPKQDFTTWLETEKDESTRIKK
ncbi:MAG: hypothetical protein ACFFD4_33145, partial [Candidatus Odinarchaeota archaeon]